MSLSKKAFARRRIVETASNIFFGEYSTCPKCNLSSVGFPRYLCNLASAVLRRSTSEMKENFIKKLIVELENDRDVNEYCDWLAGSSILQSVVGDAFGMIPFYTSVKISTGRRVGLRMQMSKKIDGVLREYYFVGDELKHKDLEIPKLQKPYGQLSWSRDLCNLLCDANWDKFSPTTRLYCDGKVFCDIIPNDESHLIFTPDPSLVDDVCIAWIDTSLPVDFRGENLSCETPSHHSKKKQLIRIAVDIFFGKNANCTKCNLFDARFPQSIFTNATLYKKMDHTKIAEFEQDLYDELQRNCKVEEYSTFEAQTKILKKFVGTSMGMIPFHTSIKIEPHEYAFKLLTRMGHSADVIEHYFDKGSLKQRTANLVFPKKEQMSKCLSVSKITSGLLEEVNVKILNHPQRLVYYDGTTFYHERPSAPHIVFGPNSRDALDEEPLVLAWINTNFYPIHKWEKNKFLCVSYFGGVDLNVLKTAEIHSKRKWKRVTIESSEQIEDGDVLCFIGDLCEWNLYVQNCLKRQRDEPMTKRRMTTTFTNGLYVHAYVYCVIIHEIFPQFTYSSEKNDEWVVRNICFETPEYKPFYDQMAADGELEYYADTVLEKNKLYAVFLPRPQTKHKITPTTEKTKEIKIKCMEMCSCEKPRKKINILVHHGDVHCTRNSTCCVVGCKATFEEPNQKSKRRDHYRKCHKFDVIPMERPVVIAKKRDLMRDAWQIGAQLKLITTTPIIGMDPIMITDKFIYSFFMSELDKLDDQTLGYAIMYIVGMNSKDTSIGKLISELCGACVYRTREQIICMCQQLLKFNAIEVTCVHNKFEISHNQLRMMTNDDSLCEAAYLKRVVSELKSSFSMCIFDIEIVRGWFAETAAEIKKLEGNAEITAKTIVHIAKEEYTAREYREFLAIFYQETASIDTSPETKWFMFIDNKLHVHLNLLMSDATIGNKSPSIVLDKFVRLIIRGIEETYSLNLKTNLIEHRTKTKELFFMSHDVSSYPYARELIFDLATIVCMYKDRNTNFLVATKPIINEVCPRIEFDVDRMNAPRELTQPTASQTRSTFKKSGYILFNITREMHLLSKNFKIAHGYVEFSLFSNVCNVFRSCDIPYDQLENFKNKKLKGVYEYEDEVYVCLSLVAEPAQSIAIALLEYSGCFHFKPTDDLKKFNKKHCGDEFFLRGLRFLKARPYQERIYERVVVDLTDEISYFISEIIEVEGHKAFVDVVIVSNVLNITNEVIRDVRMAELKAIRDGNCPGYFKIFDSTAGFRKIYCHLPSMGCIGKRIAVALMNYSTAYHNYDDQSSDLLAGDRFEICVGDTKNVFYKALAYRPKRPVLPNPTLSEQTGFFSRKRSHGRSKIDNQAPKDLRQATPQDKIICLSPETNGTTPNKTRDHGIGIYMACQFDLNSIEDISDIITDDLLVKHPSLLEYQTEVTSDLSTISTLLDTRKMFLHWHNKSWPYMGIVKGAELKSNKNYAVSKAKPIYTIYIQTHLRSTRNQFEELVASLSDEERSALILAYTSYLCDENDFNFNKFREDLRRVSRDVQTRLVYKGLCVIDNFSKLLYPNELSMYKKYNMKTLGMYAHNFPPKKIVNHKKIMPSYKQTPAEMMQTIAEYDPKMNYKKHFLQFHDPDKLSVRECMINFTNRIVLLDLVAAVDPESKYNLHSFLDYVVVVGYRRDESTSIDHTNPGLIVTMKSPRKYRTSKVKWNTTSERVNKVQFAYVQHYVHWNVAQLLENKYQTNRPSDLTLGANGFKWILKNLHFPISNHFLEYMVATESAPGLYTVKYAKLVEYNQKIGQEYFCRVCRQFGKNHTNSAHHTGIQLATQPRPNVCVDEKSTIGDDSFNFGLRDKCNSDIYRNVCELCVKSSDVINYLCELPNKCKNGRLMGYQINCISLLSNLVCDVCGKYQGEAQNT
jgi:hypothetical protein